MKNRHIQISPLINPAKLSELATYLLRDEAISGKLILAATALALIAANTALSGAYRSLWNTDVAIGFGSMVLSKDIQHWIDDGLMAIFFLVVGLELKRELVSGELRKLKTATLPFAAAIGGMILPALIYLSLNAGKDSVNGWAIPMATDIAFAVGILALLGKKIPTSIRLFLLTLAIVDDIGAVIVIAVFYSVGINFTMLLFTTIIVSMVLLFQKLKLLNMLVFTVAGVGIWLAVNASGIHPSIAGVIIGLLAPLTTGWRGKQSISERLERFFIPISTLIVVPLFAFANTGVALSLHSLQHDATPALAGGIVLGLVFGKVVGIVGASWLVVKLRYADLPSDASWSHITGVGFLAGIGFTVAIFVTELAFTSEEYMTIAKISVFVASTVSALIGLMVLSRNKRTQS